MILIIMTFIGRFSLLGLLFFRLPLVSGHIHDPCVGVIACESLESRVSFDNLPLVKPTSGYIVLIDAGSTGSRVYIYRYISGALINSSVKATFKRETLAMKNITEVAHKRISPSLSSFVQYANDTLSPQHVEVDIDRLEKHLSSLVSYAESKMEPQRNDSPAKLSLKATAGMRSLDYLSQELIMTAARAFLQNQPMFEFSDASVISGADEALYSFLAIDSVMSQLSAPMLKHNKIAVADLGSSSKQLSFVSILSSNSERRSDITTSSENEQCNPNMAVSGISPNDGNGGSKLFAKSSSGLGLIAAMDRVIASLLPMASSQDEKQSIACVAVDSPLSHPCISLSADPLSYDISNAALHAAGYCAGPIAGSSVLQVVGAGDFDACLVAVRRSLLPLATDGVGSRCIASSSEAVTLVGLDNFPKVLEMLGLPNRGDEAASELLPFVFPAEIMTNGRKVCQRSMVDILSAFPPNTPSYRALRACFGSAFIYSLLVDVYGVSMSNDNHIEGKTHAISLDGGRDDVISSNMTSDPFLRFAAVDAFGGFELSWALGAAVSLALNLRVEHL